MHNALTGIHIAKANMAYELHYFFSNIISFHITFPSSAWPVAITLASVAIAFRPMYMVLLNPGKVHYDMNYYFTLHAINNFGLEKFYEFGF